MPYQREWNTQPHGSSGNIERFMNPNVNQSCISNLFGNRQIGGHDIYLAPLQHSGKPSEATIVHFSAVVRHSVGLLTSFCCLHTSPEADPGLI